MTTFRDLPIKRKMAVAVLGTTILALLLACGTFVVYERVNFRLAMARNLTVLADALAHNSTAALDLAKFQDNTGAAREILGALAAEPAVVVAGLYDEEGSLYTEYMRPGADEHLPSRVENDGTRFTRNYADVLRPVVLNKQRIGTIFLRADLAELNARLWTYARISGLVLLGSFLFALVLSSALQRLALRPILALTETAKRIGQTRDYSARAEKMSNDELGLLTDAFNQMLGDIEERTTAVQVANEASREQASEMRLAARVLASSANQIVTAIRQLAGSASDAATAVRETTTTVEEVRQTSQFSSERAKFVSDQAQTASEVATTGENSVNQTIEGMNGIRAQMAVIAESILNLSAQSQAIGEIIASVEDLAAQSKLLAVNATIEAAKAGEGGKGFSVVAQEVKSLAAQSRQATGQVRAILSEIQKAMNLAVLSTEQGSKAVEAGVRQSSAAGEAIAALAGSIAKAAQAATQIAVTSREQFAGMEQVALAMESIKQASGQTVSSTEQVENAARQLQELGQKLQDLVEKLKV